MARWCSAGSSPKRRCCRPPPGVRGYRLLQEYFAMPERFLFVDLQGLRPALKRAAGADVDIYILLREGHRDLAPMIVPEPSP